MGLESWVRLLHGKTIMIMLKQLFFLFSRKDCKWYASKKELSGTNNFARPFKSLPRCAQPLLLSACTSDRESGLLKNFVPYWNRAESTTKITVFQDAAAAYSFLCWWLQTFQLYLFTYIKLLKLLFLRTNYLANCCPKLWYIRNLALLCM